MRQSKIHNERLTISRELTAIPERDTLMGLEGWRIPAVAVQEQVLQNNVGRMLVRQEEISESAERWLDMPVTLGHPSVRGRPVSGRTPEALNTYGIGRLVNAREEDGQLKVDVFLFDHRLEQFEVEDEIVEKVENDEPIEVSTGFGGRFRHDEGTFQNEEYDIVAEWIDPDHFAILLEGTGACSVEDGCGLGINVLSDSRTRSELAGTGEVDEGEVPDWWPPSLSRYVDALDLEPNEEAEGDEVTSVGDLTQEGRNQIASHTLLGDPDADSISQLSFFPVVDPESGDILENALRAVIGGRGAQADIPAAAEESAQSVARGILEDEDLIETDDEGDAENVENMFRRFLAFLEDRFGSEAAENQDELSLDDIRALIREELDQSFGAQDRFVHVVELFEDRVIYEISVQGGEDTLWRAPYTVDAESEEVTFGDREQVERVVEFVPAENEEIEVVENYLPTSPEPAADEEFAIENGRIVARCGE